MTAALLATLLLSCDSTPPAPTAPELVLYLREAQPSAGSAFGRVNPRTFDLGSLSSQPPDRMELRACGDVVAYAGQPGMLPDESIEVREVLYRLWWTSGVGRGVLSLWSPGQGGGLAVHPVSSCVVPSDDPRHDNGFFRTTARVPVGRTMSGADLAGLHLLMDVASAQVVVGSCPSRASLLVINPPPDEVLAARDSDGDGVSDLDELQGTGDPWRADAGASCLRHADPVAELPACPLPETALESVRLDAIHGDSHWEGRALRVEGLLRVEGVLRISGGTVLFAPGADGRAGIFVAPGGRLEVSDGALLGAADPAVGFSLRAGEGSTLRLVDSELRHVGTIEIDGNGFARSEGVLVETSQAEIRGNTFRWSLAVLEILAPDVQVRDNRFEHVGTAVLVRAPRVVVEGNQALGGGLFARVDAGGDEARIAGNRLERTVDIGIKITEETRGVVVEGNELVNVHQGVEFRRVEDLVLRDNRVQACIQPFLPLPAEAPPGVRIEGNTLLPPDPSACRIVLPQDFPDLYPGDVQGSGDPRARTPGAPGR